MKVCFVTLEGAREPKTWSGTPKALIECMEQKGIEIQNLSYLGKNHHYGLGKIKCLIDKFIYCYGSTFRDPFPYWYRMNANFFEKEMTKFDSDVFLFMGEQCLKNKTKINGKVYVYMDRVNGKIAQYDEDTRRGKSWYIKKYSENDKVSLSCMDHIFTMNDWSRNELVERYGVPEDKVTNVGFGVNITGYHGDKNYNNHKMLVVLRKGTEHYKGLDLLLEAFTIAKKVIPDLTLHVVGTNYKELEGVVYYYDQPRSLTVKLFQECSLYVMPALLEPNGITYLEALANKAPAIGLNRFAFPEFCGYGKYGFIVNEETAECVADTIIKAYSDPHTLEKMGKKGQEFALKNFSWKKTTDRILAIIQNEGGTMNV